MGSATEDSNTETPGATTHSDGWRILSKSLPTAAIPPLAITAMVSEATTPVPRKRRTSVDYAVYTEVIRKRREAAGHAERQQQQHADTPGDSDHACPACGSSRDSWAKPRYTQRSNADSNCSWDAPTIIGRTSINSATALRADDAEVSQKLQDLIVGEQKVEVELRDVSSKLDALIKSVSTCLERLPPCNDDSQRAPSKNTKASLIRISRSENKPHIGPRPPSWPLQAPRAINTPTDGVLHDTASEYSSAHDSGTGSKEVFRRRRPSVSSCASQRPSMRMEQMVMSFKDAASASSGASVVSMLANSAPIEEVLGEGTVTSTLAFSGLGLGVANVPVSNVLAVNSRSATSRKIWQFEEPGSSLFALIFARGILLTIVVSVVVGTVNTHEPPLFPPWIEMAIDLFFALEICVRFFVSPNRFAFFSDPSNIVDLMASLSLPVRALMFSGAVFSKERQEILRAMLQCVPLLRILKLLRRFEKFELLKAAFLIALEALPVLIYMLTVIVMFFSTLIFFIEPRSNINTMLDAMYLCIVTVTTVGYGDATPESVPGKLITSCFMVVGSLYMAVPLGIVGGSFSQVWHDRDRRLLINRTVRSLAQWGYTPTDLPELFCVFDKDEDGLLDLNEFREMLEQMNLGLGGERVEQLFRFFDSDGGGAIDLKEFVRGLFPQAFSDIAFDGDENTGPTSPSPLLLQEEMRTDGNTATAFAIAKASEEIAVAAKSITGDNQVEIAIKDEGVLV